jgi:hypothetical protein
MRPTAAPFEQRCLDCRRPVRGVAGDRYQAARRCAQCEPAYMASLNWRQVRRAEEVTRA